VRGLPGGDQTVLAGGNMTFTGIPSGTLARVTAQPGVGCKLDYWMIDGVRDPSNPNVTPDLTKYLTINSDRTVVAVCVVFTPVTLTVTYNEFCPLYYCPIMVSYSGGGGTISPGDPPTEFTGIVPGTVVTLSIQSGDCDGSPYNWNLDGVPQGYIPEVWQITMGANHTVEAMCGEFLEG